VTSVIVFFSDRGILEKYYSLEFSSLTIVVNSEHFLAFLQYKTEAIPGKLLKRKVTQEETRERRNSMKKTDNVKE
jgi:hypothetical protein